MISFPEIIADECIDRRLVSHLQNNSYKVFDIFHSARGSSDEEIISLAGKLTAFILTEDKDFGNELVYNNKLHHGALLIRLDGVAIDEKRNFCSMYCSNMQMNCLKTFLY